jgi:hypothetical protein
MYDPSRFVGCDLLLWVSVQCCFSIVHVIVQICNLRRHAPWIVWEPLNMINTFSHNTIWKVCHLLSLYLYLIKGNCPKSTLFERYLLSTLALYSGGSSPPQFPFGGGSPPPQRCVGWSSPSLPLCGGESPQPVPFVRLVGWEATPTTFCGGGATLHCFPLWGGGWRWVDLHPSFILIFFLGIIAHMES